MKTLDIEYHADGARLVGYLAVDEMRAGKRPGVLVAPEGGGLVDLTKSIARRLAEIGKLTLVDGLERTRADAPRQLEMANSIRQCANVLDAFVVTDPLPSGPGLVVDDVIASRWTMTAVAETLRAAGADSVLPLALWQRP